MKKILLTLLVAVAISTISFGQGNFNSNVASGNWNSAGSWTLVSGSDGDGIPDADDNVTILNGNTITLTDDRSCASLIVGGGISGVFNSTGNDDLTVVGNLTINAGAVFEPTGDNALFLGGNLINGGTFNANNGANDMDVTFNGSANQTVSGTGGTTDFNLITINNTGAAGSNIVDITSTNFTAVSGFLTLTDGVFKVSGSFVITNTFFPDAGLTINSDEGFWLNNANATVTATNNSTTLNGSLRISAGIYNLGTTNNSLTWGNNSVFTMEGGALNIAARFAPSSATSTNVITFNMSGGTLTTSMGSSATPNASGTIASFDIPATGLTSSFTMSNGTIVMQKAASAVDYRMSTPGTVSITGGTVQFGNASTSGSPAFDVGAASGATNVFPSLTVNATGTPTVTMQTAATVRGNISILTGTTLNANSLAITVSGNAAAPGNWTNNGTFTPGTQTVTFSGSNMQTIGGATAFSSLTINNASGVTAAANHSVAGTLTLTSGLLNIGTNTLTLTNATDVTQLSGGSTTSYVVATGVGRLRRNDITGTALLFPVGSPTYYLPATVNPVTSSDFAVNVFEGVTSNGVEGGPSMILSGNVNAIWNVDRPTGSGNAAITLDWNNGSPALEGIAFFNFPDASIGISRFAGSWQNATGSGNNTTNIATGTFSSFSPFGVGFIGVPLPVKFSGITAFEKQTGVQIDWNVATEENTSRYQVERSADGITFTAIGSVDARNQPKYGYYDATPLPGVSYYRLRSIDVDGKASYSSIVRVNLNKNDKEIRLYPNPVTGGNLSFQSSDLSKGTYSIRIFNAGGQQVYTQKFTHTGGALNQTIQLPGAMKSGMYNIQLENDGERVMSKSFVVK